MPLMKSVKSDFEKAEPIRQQTTELVKTKSNDTPSNSSDKATRKSASPVEGIKRQNTLKSIR